MAEKISKAWPNKNLVDLSIVIISFNTEKLTRECIESVIKNTKGITYEFIVVDNDSKNGSVAMLKKFPVRLIANKDNRGFGQANNQGMEISNGRYVLLLNSDTLVGSNVLANMVSWMDKNPKAGIASCGLRFKDGKIQGTGGYFPTLARVFAWMSFLDDIPGIMKLIKPFHPMHGLSPFDKNIDFFRKEKQMDWVTGAFLLMRKEIYDEVGGFDKAYFMYVEEVDLCFRAKVAGWQVWYLPRWNIIHYGGASSTAEFPLINEVKSLKTFYQLRMPKWQYPILRVILKFGALLRIPIFGKVYAKVFVTA